MLSGLRIELTEREKQLIWFIREFGSGELKIRVENTQPVFIYESVRTLKLGENGLKNRTNPHGEKSLR